MTPHIGPVFDSLPLAERTISNLLVRASTMRGGAPFLDVDDDVVVFGDLPQLAAAFAGGLECHGVGRGQHVATLLPNCTEFATTLVGTSWAGAVLVPLGVELTPAWLATRLDHSDAVAIVVHESSVPTLQAALALGVPQLRVVVVVGAAGRDIDVPTSVGWNSFMSAQKTEAAPVSYDDVFMINYTSGTTGPSKGVVTSHHHAYCASVPLVDGFGWTSDDVLWTSLPLNHAAGLYHVLLPALAVGANAVIKPRFSLSSFWSDVVGAGATYAQMIATMANLLMKQPAGDLDRAHRLSSISCFPAPNDPDAFEARFGVHLNTQAWGMTEVYPNQPSPAQERRGPTCIGRPSPLFDVRVVDENDVEVPSDGVAVGEIVVRPRVPSGMMREYYKNPEATVAATRNLWFHTGDQASRDADSFMYFVGRTKDMIRRRGENISAFELEREILTFAGVGQAAAYAVPSDLGEDEVRVDVVPTEGDSVDLVELTRVLRESLPRYMMPRYLCIRDALPMTPSGRVEKYKLAAQGEGTSVLDTTLVPPPSSDSLL